MLTKLFFDILFDTNRCFAHKRTFTLLAGLHLFIQEIFVLAYLKVIDMSNLHILEAFKLFAITIFATFLITDIAYFLNDYFLRKPVFRTFLSLVTSVKITAIVINHAFYPVFIKSDNENKGIILLGITAVTFLVSFIIFCKSKNHNPVPSIGLYYIIYDKCLQKIFDGIFIYKKDVKRKNKKEEKELSRKKKIIISENNKKLKEEEKAQKKVEKENEKEIKEREKIKEEMRKGGYTFVNKNKM